MTLLTHSVCMRTAEKGEYCAYYEQINWSFFI